LATGAQAAYRYPPAAIHVVSDTLQGEVIEDPYRWLEDREDPATGDWIARETAFTDSVLATVPGREAIRSRIRQLVHVESQSVPVVRGDRTFFTRSEADQDLPVLCLRRGGSSVNQVLLDPQQLSADHSVTASY